MLIFKRGPGPKTIGGVHHKTQPASLDQTHARTLLYLKQYVGGHEAQAIWLAGQKIHDLTERTFYYTQAVLHVEERLTGTVSQSLRDFAMYRWQPVGVEEFICSHDYLNKAKEIYPEVLEAAKELNNGYFVEAVLTGGIGSGKTTLALHTNAYQLYLLSCMRSPHKLFGLDPSSEILLIFQSITKNLAMGVDYQRFRNMIAGSPYFQKHYPFDKGLMAKMVFPNRVEVVPVAGTETAAIGQNVMGGLIDELNYMAIVEKSKVAVDKGTYDQALLVYNSISRRRKSRFMENGKLPGILCLVSSKKYPGQFTDQKIEEAKKDPTIYIYDKRVWDIKPEGFGNHGWVQVFAGDMTRKPRVLDKDEEVPDEDRGLVVAVPEEFRGEFEKDVINALREIAGVSTLARHPFFLEVQKVNAAFRKNQPSIFSQSPVDFVTKRLKLLKNAFHQPDLPRFVHIDLALTGDSAGIAVGTVTGFVEVSKSGDTPLYMPNIRIDGVLEVRPPRNGEILFAKIRQVLLSLLVMGLRVRWVTMDQFQSADTKQILQQAGFMTGLQSMDKVPCHPYDFFKMAVYEGRLTMPFFPHLQREMVMLEKDTKTLRVDHPPGGCFTGETRVALANGTCPTFRELAQMPPEETFYVYAIGAKGLEIAPARYARVTKTVQLIAEVLLDNYQVIRCTPDHLFMTLGGQWIQAQELDPTVSLMPLYRSSSPKGGWFDYERVWCPVRQERFLTHHLAFGPVPAGHVIHHEDENKRNNDPRNLKALTRRGHASHHGNNSWANKQQAMKKGFDQYFSQGSNAAKQSGLMKELWLEGKFEKPQRTSNQTNHRVLDVTMVITHEEVFDLTVPKLENFALASGVFVHNSKDCADAVAGVVYGLTLRREIWAIHRIPVLSVPQQIRDVGEKLKQESDQPEYQQEIESDERDEQRLFRPRRVNL